ARARPRAPSRRPRRARGRARAPGALSPRPARGTVAAVKPSAHGRSLGLDTLAIHAGQPPDPTSGAVMTPIVRSSSFAQEAPGQHKGFEYSRSGNPTRNALEACLAALEGGTHGFAFASGLGAETTLFHTLSPGDHVLAGDDLYGGTFRLLDKVFSRLG